MGATHETRIRAIQGHPALFVVVDALTLSPPSRISKRPSTRR
jgi:hypothetical protein